MARRDTISGTGDEGDDGDDEEEEEEGEGDGDSSEYRREDSSPPPEGVAYLGGPFLAGA